MLFSKKSKVTVTSYYCKKCGISKFVRSIDPEFNGICKVCGQPMEKEWTRPYDTSKKLPDHLKTNYHESENKYKNIVSNNDSSDQISDSNKPRVTCPYCHSTNCTKISGLNRAVSIGFWGLMSKKIGKQWHCNGCGSDF